MQNNVIAARTFKDDAYGAFAEVSKALSNPRRLELIDVLVQGPRSVEGLANALNQSIGTASQHLQVLKRARVVQTTRHGTTIEYSLAPGMAVVFASLRRLAESRSRELAATKREYYASADAEETIDPHSLAKHLDAQTAILIDVRPRSEYAHGHIDGTRSIPLEQLEHRIDELPTDQLVVATCRGPYCVFAADAVRLLRAHGRQAVRFEGGIAEWRLDGGRIATGEAS